MAESILNIPRPKLYETEALYQEKLAAGEVDEKDYSFVKDKGVIHIQGGTFGDGVEARILHVPAEGSSLTEEQIAYNVETYNKMMAGGKIQLFLYNGPESPLVPLALDNVVEGIMVFNHPSFLVDTEINSLMFTLKSDGSTTFAQHTYPLRSTIDTELSDTSENAVQNKAIKAYVDASAEMSMPLSRDFNNDFNNDFAI